MNENQLQTVDPAAPENRSGFPQTQGSQGSESAVVQVEQSRAQREVEAAMAVAKRFPRDEYACNSKILKACERYGLAEDAMYSYPRGGELVKGPSIQLAREIARIWGSIKYGYREIQLEGKSEIECFAWDLETNTQEIKHVVVPHTRTSKRKGTYSLNDPRDIYEQVANMASRRVRSCILGIIPGDIVEAACRQVQKTLAAGDGNKSKSERIKELILAFDKLGVSQDLLESRLGHNIDATIETELGELRMIYKSIIDGNSKREDYFDVGSAEGGHARELNDQFSKESDDTREIGSEGRLKKDKESK